MVKIKKPKLKKQPSVGPKLSKAVNGSNVKAQDSTYFDTKGSRKRAVAWNPGKHWEQMPWIAGVLACLGSVLFVSVLCVILLPLFQMFYGMIPGNTNPNAFYTSVLGINWHGSEYTSFFIWGLSRWWNWLIGIILGGIGGVWLGMYNKRIKAMNSGEDMNNYEGDASVLTIPELVEKYLAVPDKGAHTRSVNATAIVAHLPISNKGLKKQMLPVLAPDGDPNKKFDFVGTKAMLPVYETNEQGQKVIKTSMQDLVDEEDAVRQLVNVGMTDKRYHKLHNPTKLIVNSKKNKTLADFINEDWYTPAYETQKPSGIYLVDDSPINTLIVAMTRGNKGQTMINPTIDIWTRQDKTQNLFINDPKGELYNSFYATLKMRGYETVVFNLLDSMFTDQYNPLAPAITYLRKGYMDEPQKSLTALADNFFPMPKGGEPIWTKGEQTLFNILCLVLMDVYYEEEQEYLDKYSGVYDEARIQRDIDKLWSHVTLPNVYRMVSVLATREYVPKDLNGNEVEAEGDSKNMLEELFDLTNQLPTSNIRQLFATPYGNLMAMADSDKMRSSIYGMTLTEMAFFVEGPVVALTNASPKRSFDLISMSFPRRFQFKLNDKFVQDRGIVSMPVEFELYRDPFFKDKYEGKDYEHVTRIDKLSWVEMRFGAVLDQDITYVKMTIKPRDQHSSVVYGTYYAMFVKGYAKNPVDGSFIMDPITNEYQVKDGVLYAGVLDENGQFTHKIKPKEMLSTGKIVPVFDLTDVSYIEKPLAVFSVTPPSALVYVKIVLMIIHSMFNATVENSYMTKDNGKPLLKTKYMLDEAGNLSYQGNGIDGLPTKLSIGLAQGQEYTLVFQTLQQITDVYGETADKIISSNTGLMAFLLSSDITMLETLSKQAGVHHVDRKNSRTMTQHVGTMVDAIEDSVSYTMSIVEEPLFTVNRLLHMTSGEALMLSTTKRNNNDGSNSRQQPIFDTQDTSLPMSWSMHKFGYGQRSYSMLTVPTQNSTVGMDDQIPAFESIIYKRARQAALAPEIIKRYKEEHNLSDIEYDLKDPKEVGKEIMRIINRQLNKIDKVSRDEVEAKAAGNEQFADADSVSDESKQMDADLADMPDVDFDLEQQEEDETYDLGLTREDMQDIVEATAGIQTTIDGDSSDGVKIVNAKKSVEVAKQAKNYERTVSAQSKIKQYGGGKFSEDDMRLGTFKTALNYALAKVGPGTFENNPDWNYPHVEGNETPKLYYKGTVVAEEQTAKQDQPAIVSDDSGDGVDQVMLGKQTVTGKSWLIKDEFINALMDDKDWSSTFGGGFVNEIESYLHTSKAN